MDKKTVVFIFDGTIHSYESGWKGETIITDPVVPGIKDEIKKLKDAGYEIVVVSPRCRTPEGYKAVKNYLENESVEFDNLTSILPPAIATIDFRGICFEGKSKGLAEKIQNFAPWTEINKTKVESKSTLSDGKFKTVSDVEMMEVKLLIPLDENFEIARSIQKMYKKTVTLSMVMNEYKQLSVYDKPNAEEDDNSKVIPFGTQVKIDDTGVVRTSADNGEVEINEEKYNEVSAGAEDVDQDNIDYCEQA